MEPTPPNDSALVRRFDLNMKEDLLEAWTPSDGIRELIANALDEQVLTATRPVSIAFDGGSKAHIRDYGRGLRYEHFAQGEDDEKLSNPDRVIGKFGVGLKDVVFATVDEQRKKRDLLDHAREDGYEIITVPDNIRRELADEKDVEGNKMRDVGAYTTQYNESFQHEWVDEGELSKQERTVWELRHPILNLIEDLPAIDEIRVSETMRITGGEGWKTRGTWQPDERRIVIHRPVLRDSVTFASVLLHEVAHPKSGNAPDQTREFEEALTDMLGECAMAAIGRSDSVL